MFLRVMCVHMCILTFLFVRGILERVSLSKTRTVLGMESRVPTPNEGQSMVTVKR